MRNANAQTHTYTYTKALSKRATSNRKESDLVYISVTSCVCYVHVGASGGLDNKRLIWTVFWCALWQSNQKHLQYTCKRYAFEWKSINFAHSFIHFYPCVSNGCVCVEQKRVKFLSSLFFYIYIMHVYVYGCGAFYRYNEFWLCIWHEIYTHIISILICGEMLYHKLTLHTHECTVTKSSSNGIAHRIAHEFGYQLNGTHILFVGSA